jgi:hypothetical protein
MVSGKVFNIGEKWGEDGRRDLYGKWLAEGMLRFETCEIVSIKSFSGGPATAMQWLSEPLPTFPNLPQP